MATSYAAISRYFNRRARWADGIELHFQAPTDCWRSICLRERTCQRIRRCISTRSPGS